MDRDLLKSDKVLKVEENKNEWQMCDKCKKDIPRGCIMLTCVEGSQKPKRWHLQQSHLPKTFEQDFWGIRLIEGFDQLTQKDKEYVQHVLQEKLKKKGTESVNNNNGPQRMEKQDQMARRQQEKEEETYQARGYTQDQRVRFNAFVAEIESNKRFKVKQLEEVLIKNKQYFSGSKGALVQLVADCRVLGAIPQCPKCKQNKLSFNRFNGQYKCRHCYHVANKIYCKGRFQRSQIERTEFQQ